MFKLTSLRFIGIVMLSMFIFSNSAVAADCNESSPNLTDQGEDYYDLDLEHAVSEKKKADLDTFIKAISGTWEGKLSYMDCTGSIKNPVRRHKNADITTAKIRGGQNDSFSVNYEAHYSKLNKVTLHKLTTLGSNNIAHIKFPNKSSLVFSERHRRGTRNRSKNGNKITTLVETIYKIEHGDDTLTLEMTTYFNGYFAWNEQLSLTVK